MKVFSIKFHFHRTFLTVADDDLENVLNWPHPFFGCQSMLKFGKLKVEDSLTINDSIPKKQKYGFQGPFYESKF